MPRAAHVRIVRIREWFPPHDPLAAKIARLCILREDLLLEMEGVHTEDIETLDDHSAIFRRMYFLRNLIRTQMEVSGGIQVLLNDAEFKGLLESASAETKVAFEEGRRVISKAHPVAKEVRNEVCGHLLEKAVQEALERIDTEAWGFLDLSRTAQRTHYKFAAELIAEMLLKGVSDSERRQIESSKFEIIADMVAIFSLIEHCVLLYAQDRKLLP